MSGHHSRPHGLWGESLLFCQAAGWAPPLRNPCFAQARGALYGHPSNACVGLRVLYAPGKQIKRSTVTRATALNCSSLRLGYTQKEGAVKRGSLLVFRAAVIRPWKLRQKLPVFDAPKNKQVDPLVTRTMVRGADYWLPAAQ